MGCGASAAAALTDEERELLAAAQRRSHMIQKQQEEEKRQEENIQKLLLLGAGESGKSTFFKQMIEIYGGGFKHNELLSYIPIIFGNTISAMQILIDETPRFAGDLIAKWSSEMKSHAFSVKQQQATAGKLAPKIATDIAALWADPAIQRTYENRSKFQLFDSASYYLEKVMELAANNYMPTTQDVLRSRVRTTGIVENRFLIGDDAQGKKVIFKMFDVGGQRNERRKWIHCFEGVTAVIFIAAISEYDQVVREDNQTNRMDEALNLFNEICNSKWFERTSMILFLNKSDLFYEKLKKVPLTVWADGERAPQYTGPEGDQTNEEAAALFMQQMFTDQLDKEIVGTKTIYAHVTCATDTNNIRKVFNAVKDIIIRNSLDQAGLV